VRNFVVDIPFVSCFEVFLNSDSSQDKSVCSGQHDMFVISS
jgi:hypothetical protein